MKSHLIGNWKMNFTVAKSLETAIKIAESLPADSPVCTVVCPQFPALAGVAEVVGGTSLKVGAQNVSHRTEPASTGEVSLEALRDLAEFVLVGHSERRAMGETSRQVAAKACAVGGSGLTAVVCVGESGADRQEGLTENVISQQLQASLEGYKSWEKLTVAYEPVWAIGTGVLPTAEQIASVMELITRVLTRLAGGAQVPLLYGGSVTPANIAELAAVRGVAGFLVGGASLNPDSFIAMYKILSE